jgi:hypothetical protein
VLLITAASPYEPAVKTFSPPARCTDENKLYIKVIDLDAIDNFVVDDFFI